MAIAISNHLFVSISGRLGNVVFYSRKNTLCVRNCVVPRNPDTHAQRRVRRAFACAVKAWQALPQEEKHIYMHRARYLNMSGYNLFISRYMKASPAPAQGRVKACHEITVHGAIRSVSGPFPLHSRVLYFPGTGT